MAPIYSFFTQIKEKFSLDLIGEHTNLRDFYNSKKVKEKVAFSAFFGKSVSEITTDLIQNQNDLRPFHFSRHSDQDTLIFQEADFSKEHFVYFFKALNSTAQKIDCVFLCFFVPVRQPSSNFTLFHR